MSVCSSGFRTLSRSRVSAARTLVPFLYQTATIQQWKPAAQPIAHRNVSSRPDYEHDIPFDDETILPSVNEVKSHKTTITGSERAAFEKLYKKFNAPPRPPPSRSEHEVDQIADEYYEDEEDDPSAATLNTLFDSVLKKKKKSPKIRKVEDLATLAEDILRPEMEAARMKSKKDAAERAARVKRMQNAEKTRVKQLLEGAKTDKELWDILETEVFSVIRAMELDKPRSQINGNGMAGKNHEGTNAQQDAALRPIAQSGGPDAVAPRFPTSPIDTVYDPPLRDIARYEPGIVFPNFSYHLIVAAQTLRNNFPSSPLPLSIIPTLKSLGRSSYALGATTSLYKILLRTAWLQQQSYTHVCSLLQDMDNGGIECDFGVLKLLDEILMEYRMARSGRMGRPLQAVLGMELFEEGIRKLKAWRDMTAKRLGAWSEKRTVKGEVVRKVGLKGPRARGSGGPASVRGPRDELLVAEAGMGLTKLEASDEHVPLVEGGMEDATTTMNSSGVEDLYMDDVLVSESDSLDLAQGRKRELANQPPAV